MPHNYSTALSHIILAGTGIYCGRRVVELPFVSYGLIVTNSIIGLWRYGNPKHGDDAQGIYNFTALLQKLFALPCIVTTLWLNNGLKPELAYIHIGLSLLPLISRHRNELIDSILGLNVISLAVVSFMSENYWGLAAAVSFMIAHFYIRDEGDFQEIPAQDMYNYGLCFFAYFALMALAQVSIKGVF